MLVRVVVFSRRTYLQQKIKKDSNLPFSIGSRYYVDTVYLYVVHEAIKLHS